MIVTRCMSSSQRGISVLCMPLRWGMVMCDAVAAQREVSSSLRTKSQQGAPVREKSCYLGNTCSQCPCTCTYILTSSFTHVPALSSYTVICKVPHPFLPQQYGSHDVVITFRVTTRHISSRHWPTKSRTERKAFCHRNIENPHSRI